MTENLKICPFCGSEAEIIGYDDGMYQCVCQNCKSTQGVFYDFPEEAAFAWNNRPIEEEQAAEIARLLGNIEAIKKIVDKPPLSIYAAARIYAECCDALKVGAK